MLQGMVRSLVGFFSAWVNAALFATLVLVWFIGRISQSGPLPEDRAVLVPYGSGVVGIGRQLAEEGVIDTPEYFVLAAALLRGSGGLQAGEYLFPAGVSVVDAVALVRSGRTIVHRLTIPEGLTSMQVVGLVAAEPALSGTILAVPANGTLLPETYHFTRGDDRNALLVRMQTAMQAALDDAWGRRSPKLAITTPVQAMILASVVEKETGIAEERPRVAGVFHNRLTSGMKLQSDPTVIFALTNGEAELGRLLTRADWRFESPYNTYVVDGLPPAPIANPGKAALEATLRPERHDFLYFVANGSGGHSFARSLGDHNRNVAAWKQQNLADAVRAPSAPAPSAPAVAAPPAVSAPGVPAATTP